MIAPRRNRRFWVVVRFFLMSLLPFSAHAQGEGDMWFFGDSVLLDFNPALAQQGAMPVVVPGAILNARNCSSTLCTADGRILIYTNGWQMNDSDHTNYANWVPNQNWSGNQDATQGNLLLKVNDSLVFLFRYADSPTSIFHASFTYRKIHLNRNNGQGWVDPIDYPAMDSATYQLSAIRHANGKDWWVFSHKAESDVFFRMYITETGVVTIDRQRIGNTHPPLYVLYCGQLAISPHGDRFAIPSHQGRIDILDFDRCTGELEMFGVIDKARDDSNFVYGLSFSPSGQLLYQSDGYFGPIGFPDGVESRLYQFDLNSPNITASELEIWRTPDCDTCRRILGLHKLGPDGRIYMAHGIDDLHDEVRDTLMAILNPDIRGLGCNFDPHAVLLSPGKSRWGIPNMPDYRLGPQTAATADLGPDILVCPGDTVLLPANGYAAGSPLTWAWTPLAGATAPVSVGAGWAAQVQAGAPGSAALYVLTLTDTTVSPACATTRDTIAVLTTDPAGSPADLLPPGLLGPDSVLCLGDSLRLSPAGLLPGWTATWTGAGLLNPGPALLALPPSSGTYTLLVTDSAGSPAGTGLACRRYMDTLAVAVELPLDHPAPPAGPGPGGTWPFCPGEAVRIGTEALPGMAYRWTPASWLDRPDAALVTASPPEATVYQLHVTSDTHRTARCAAQTFQVALTTDGCIRQDVLTPNDDGVNDLLHIGDHAQAPAISVFDRWGARVFFDPAYTNDWGGTGLPDGVYWYEVVPQGRGLSAGKGGRWVSSLTVLR
jgi:gliding motility-associated-like protein